MVGRTMIGKSFETAKIYVRTAMNRTASSAVTGQSWQKNHERTDCPDRTYRKTAIGRLWWTGRQRTRWHKRSGQQGQSRNRTAKTVLEDSISRKESTEKTVVNVTATIGQLQKDWKVAEDSQDKPTVSRSRKPWEDNPDWHLKILKDFKNTDFGTSYVTSYFLIIFH